MNLHEYQAKELLASYGLNIPKGIVVTTGLEAKWAAKQLLKPDDVVVVKAQIHSGGRGKAGGVKIATTPEKAMAITESMIGTTLYTKQTGPQGKLVRKILVCEGTNIDKEFYLALFINRDTANIGIMVSAEGGVDIEEVAETHPEKILYADVDPTIGYQSYTTKKVHAALGLPQSYAKELDKILRSLYDVFIKFDCEMIEINPLVLTKEGRLVILDCKIGIEGNAVFRQPRIQAFRDLHEEEPKELAASEYNLNYIALEGKIGCLVNGAGLAMATMDIIKQYGGDPANFLDVGGGATQENVTQAFRIILQDEAVKGIFVNIFGGIMKCDIIAHGIIAATKELGLTVPVVVRLEGTNVELGRQMIQESGLRIVSASSMADGAEKIVQLVK
jgi:succinyl-CoA synthetase beta subunit